MCLNTLYFLLNNLSNWPLIDSGECTGTYEHRVLHRHVLCRVLRVVLCRFLRTMRKKFMVQLAAALVHECNHPKHPTRGMLSVRTIYAWLSMAGEKIHQNNHSDRLHSVSCQINSWLLRKAVRASDGRAARHKLLSPKSTTDEQRISHKPETLSSRPTSWSNTAAVLPQP